MNKEHEMENPLSKKVQKILSFDLDKDTLNSLKNVSELVTDNNLTTRRNLRANIEQQSLQINEKFIKAFNEAFKHLQVLGDQVNFIDESCQNMMTKIEELKFQTSDFLQQTSEVNSELQRLDINEKVLGQFINKFQLNQNEISLLTSNIEKNQSIDDRFFDVLQKIQSIHETSKRQLANNQYITGFEIMDSMSKYEEMADDKLYRWTICILRTINVDTIELHSHLFRAIAHLHRKDVLFKHCIDEYIIVRRSAVSHVFIEALTRGRTSNNTHYPAMERYSHDIIRYISDMLSFLHQTIVFEKDMLNSLLKYCDQEKLANQNTVKTTLASISEGLSRPLKIRIENSLISNNKTATVKLTTEKQNEKTKNYFLVKNVINFYQQIFGQILSDDAPFLYFIKEMLILSDKVFYNTLNFYCSSSSSNSGGPKIDKRFQDNIPQMINIGEHLNEYVQLINELLEIIKTSITTNENDQKLETHRLLSAMIDPFFQHTIIYSSKLSSIEMTIFSYNCSLLLSQTILKYKFTEDFVGNIEKQLDEYIDVLVNEQFQQIITNLSISSFYNAIIQSEQLTTTTPLVTFSGCDHIAISTFLKLFDKFVNNPQMYRMGQLVNVNDQSTREKIWEKSLYMVCSAYDSIHSALIDPKNNYDDVIRRSIEVKMLSEAENVMDYVPFGYLLALVPLILVASVPGTVATSTTISNNQFLVYRVHQIDMPHGTFGSRNSIFNLEAITPGHITDTFIRKCALFKLSEILSENKDIFLNKVLSQSLVSAVLIIYNDLGDGLTTQEILNLQAIEKILLTNETSLPIYLVKENDEINRLYDEYLQAKETSKPKFYDFLLKNVFYDSHQFVVTGPPPLAVDDAVISSIQAKLIGAGLEDQLPTYAVVAHYDSYSAVPGLSHGADSNASGLIILLELIRVFSKLYANPKTRPGANMLFFVSGGGKINYFGTKRWLEENLDSSHTATSALFENMQFALCLDSLADSIGENGLFMYVSKPPKPGTSTSYYWQKLNDVSKRNYPLTNSSMIHKKINLADDFLSWEHERFSMRRISAFTLSTLSTPKTMRRHTMVDTYHEKYVDTLEVNANIIGEALVRQLYGSIDENLLKSDFAVSRSFIKSMFEYVANIPRAQQLLFSTSKGTFYQLPPFLKTIQSIMKKYSNNHIKILHSKLDSKNPEFKFYDPVTTNMNIFIMKPVVFDFIITITIAIYLALFYLAVKNFHYVTFSSKSSFGYENNFSKIKSK